MLFIKTKLSFIRRLVDFLHVLKIEGLEILVLPQGLDEKVDIEAIEQFHIEGFLTMNGKEYPSKFQVHSIVGNPSPEEDYDFVIFPTNNPRIMILQYSELYPDLMQWLSNQRVEYGFKMSVLNKVEETDNGQSTDGDNNGALLQDNQIEDDKVGEFEIGNQQGDTTEEIGG